MKMVQEKGKRRRKRGDLENVCSHARYVVAKAPDAQRTYPPMHFFYSIVWETKA